MLLVHQSHADKLYRQVEVDNASAVDVEATGFGDTHPKFIHCVLEVCVMHPGDMLYIPCGYWHAVASLSPSISLSFWYDAAATEV